MDMFQKVYFLRLWLFIAGIVTSPHTTQLYRPLGARAWATIYTRPGLFDAGQE